MTWGTCGGVGMQTSPTQSQMWHRLLLILNHIVDVVVARTLWAAIIFANFTLCVGPVCNYICSKAATALITQSRKLFCLV